jgi:hypothetical protein
MGNGETCLEREIGKGKGKRDTETNRIIEKFRGNHVFRFRIPLPQRGF